MSGCILNNKDNISIENPTSLFLSDTDAPITCSNNTLRGFHICIYVIPDDHNYPHKILFALQLLRNEFLLK